MTGILAAFGFKSGVTLLDTKTVTVGADGAAINVSRRRGYIFSVIGSINDDVSAIYGGTIGSVYWDEGSSSYYLSIGGATNSGWTSLTIGTKTLLRSSATFAAGTWGWGSSDTVLTQAFGANGSTVQVYFN